MSLRGTRSLVDLRPIRLHEYLPLAVFRVIEKLVFSDTLRLHLAAHFPIELLQGGHRVLTYGLPILRIAPQNGHGETISLHDEVFVRGMYSPEELAKISMDL